MSLESMPNRRILAADDEVKILEELCKVLAPENATGRELKALQSRLFAVADNGVCPQTGYDVHCCCQGDEAVDAVRQAVADDRPFAAAFLDVRMPPGPDGVWAAEQIRKLDPNIQIVMMTGYSDFDINEIAQRVPPEDKLLYIQKPLHAQEIRQFARALAAKWQSDTLLHKQNEHLVAVNQKLVEYDRMKSEFVMTVSHELRTPLTIFKNILSNAMAGVMGKIPPKLEHNMKIADEAINRLATIIGDFLDISKLEMGRMKLDREVLSVQTVAGEIVEMIRFVTENKGIELTLSLPDEELLIFADYEKIARVINNLIENASKFVPENTGKIAVRICSHGPDRVSLSVEDNGPGIPGEHKERVFDRFVQVEKHVGPGKHGTGLGLAICKELVNLHSGRIWVEDNPAGGAIFKILLPKYHPDAEPALDAVPVEEAVSV